MNNKLTYWLLARFPRPVVVLGYLGLKWLLVFGIAAGIGYTGFLLSVLLIGASKPEVWDAVLGNLILAWLIWTIGAFMLVWFLRGLCKAIHEFFTVVLSWSYQDADKMFPKREKGNGDG
jgi:hypothetical protein